MLTAAGALTRNPVSVLQEFCQKKRMPFTIAVDDVAGAEGFVVCYLNNCTWFVMHLGLLYTHTFCVCLKTQLLIGLSFLTLPRVRIES